MAGFLALWPGLVLVVPVLLVQQLGAVLLVPLLVAVRVGPSLLELVVVREVVRDQVVHVVAGVQRVPEPSRPLFQPREQGSTTAR